MVRLDLVEPPANDEATEATQDRDREGLLDRARRLGERVEDRQHAEDEEEPPGEPEGVAIEDPHEADSIGARPAAPVSAGRTTGRPAEEVPKDGRSSVTMHRVAAPPHDVVSAPLVLFPAPAFGVLYLPVAPGTGDGLTEAYALARTAPLELADPVASFSVVAPATVVLRIRAATRPALDVRLGWDLATHRAVLQGLGLLPGSGIALLVALLPDREAIRSLVTRMGAGDRTAMAQAGGIWAECDPAPLAKL